MPPQSDLPWEEHKLTILGLFADHPLKEVRKRMENDHQFQATDAQYEYRLARWRASPKNIKKTEWRPVLAALDNFSAQYGRVRVLVRGTPLSKIEVQRRRRLCTSGQMTVSQIVSVPSIVSFEAQGRDGQWRELPFPAQSKGTEQNRILDELPLALANDQDESDPTASGNATDSNRESPEFPAPRTATSQVSVSRESVGQNFDWFTLETLSNSSVDGQGAHGWSPLPLLPTSDHLINNFSAGDGSKTKLTVRRNCPAKVLEKKFTSLFEGLENLSLGSDFGATFQFPHARLNRHGPWGHVTHAEIGRWNRQNLFSNLPQSPTISMIGAADGQLNRNFLKQVVFSIANGLAGMDDVQLVDVVRFLGQSRDVSFLILQFLEKKQGYHAKAIAESLLKAAIENKNANVLRQILETRAVDINKTLFVVDGRQYTPLQRAAALRDVAMIQTLLTFQHDKNKSSLLESPIDLLFPLPLTGSTVDVNTETAATTLIEAGYSASPPILVGILRYLHAGNLAYRLILVAPSTDHKTFWDRGIIAMAIRELDENKSLDLLHHMFRDCKTEHESRCLRQIPHNFTYSLYAAAAKGYTRVVEKLLPFTLETTSLSGALSAAMRSGHDGMVALILTRRPSFVAPPQSIDAASEEIETRYHFDNPETTPLAEAIKSRNLKNIRLCEREGSLKFLELPGHFKVAIAAAAESEDHAYVLKILRHNPSPSGSDLVQGLYHATKKGYENIARALVDAGAHPCRRRHNFWRYDGFLEFDRQEHNLAHEMALWVAAMQRNRAIVNMILDNGTSEEYLRFDEGRTTAADVLSAFIVWGDRELLLKLKECYPSITLDGWDTRKPFDVSLDYNILQFLCENKMAGERTLSCCLRKAIKTNDVDMVRVTLSLGANAADRLVLAEAVRFDTGQLLELLLGSIDRAVLQHEAKMNPRMSLYPVIAALLRGPSGLPALRRLFQSGIVDVAALSSISNHTSFLLSNNESWRFKNFFGLAIHISRAMENDNFAVIRFLMNHGCDPDTIITMEPYEGNYLTGFLAAIETKDLGLVQLFIKNNASVNKKATVAVNRTPLQKAAEVGSLEIVTLLLSHGAEVNAAPTRRAGGTALQLTAITGHCEIASALLEAGADPHMAPSKLDGRWPLEAAAEHGRMTMIELLWEFSDGEFEDSLVESAIKLAEKNGHMACKGLLHSLRETKRQEEIATGLSAQNGSLVEVSATHVGQQDDYRVQYDDDGAGLPHFQLGIEVLGSAFYDNL